MSTKNFSWIFYLIAATIIATIAVQFFWNYKNYKENKQRIANEIQLSLDNAIEEYYAILAKEDFTTIIELGEAKSDSNFIDKINYDSVFKTSNGFRKFKSVLKTDSLKREPKFEITNITLTSEDPLDAKKTDSILKSIKKGFRQERIVVDAKSNKKLSHNNSGLSYLRGKKAADSIKVLTNLKSIFFSVTTNIINYNQLDSLIINQLNKKKLPIQFIFNHLKNDTIFYTSNNSINKTDFIENITSKSTYSRNNEEFKLLYKSPNLEALKRSSLGIFLSFILALAVISSLFYLLKIIKTQKDLANIKNDLISNITHEFKTPIATVSTAIEAIENFNVLDDKEKTKKYLSMSSIQLKKLHIMVEKLLETATLDSEQLLLKKEEIDIVLIIEKLVNKHKLLTIEKKFLFSNNIKPIYLNVDVFHFENVISNLIDNAIKYGGEKIEIHVNKVLNNTEITVADNGLGISKNEQENIFDKFYRIPKGNTHDVKGFGIGLYYCRKIIEKHNGKIQLTSTKNNTIFKVSIPNE